MQRQNAPNEPLFRVDDPERIPVERYFDPEFYRQEVDTLWKRTWQMACRLEQIPEVGDWIEYVNVGKSVIVVRTDKGVKAFHNACRHRGVPIAGGVTIGASHSIAHGNCSKTGFVCPFHGWRWNMDGTNRLVYGRHVFSDRQLAPEDIDLLPCRVETWGGCAFINFDDEAPSLRETFGPVADRLEAHGIANMRSEWWYGTVIPANWKIAMEAFMEGYHVNQTHPQLPGALPTLVKVAYESSDLKPYGATSIGNLIASAKGTSTREAVAQHFRHMELNSEGMAGMFHAKEVEIARELLDAELPEDASVGLPMWYGMVGAAITEQLRERGENVPDVNAVAMSDPLSGVEFLFPNYFMLPVFTSMSSYRIRPLGPESSFFEIWSLTHFAEGEEPDVPMEPTVLAYDSPDFPAIPRQDYSNIPIQQAGLHSEGFQYMRLSEHVEGMISNYQRIIDGYIAGKSGEELARATHQLGGNFDGPIRELGL